MDHSQHAFVMEITSLRMNYVRLRVVACLACSTSTSIISCTGCVMGMMDYGIGHQARQSVPFREWRDQVG